jgi:(1->4)-alpha-D-glucan 1-alpha-D-glucosylmutase
VNDPIATYRLQLLPHLDRARVDEALDYLNELGVSHAYLSPCFEAGSGSTHGYDVVSFERTLGMLGPDGERYLESALKSRNLRAVIDMVPNHMSTRVSENGWWRDVLEHGRRSEYHSYFDLDLEADKDGKLVLPLLPAPIERLIEERLVQAERLEDGRTVLRTPREVLPLAQGSVESTKSLPELLARQHYRLIEARRGNGQVNYRRYLDIMELTAIRVEQPEVFDAVHERLLRWVERGFAHGVRVDHPDGLADPGGYFARLRSAAPGAWLLAEKALRPGEKLPESWNVDGTTGYDFMTLSLGLFVDRDGLSALEAHWAELTSSEPRRFAELATEGKVFALRELFPAELQRTARAARVALIKSADVSAEACAAAVEELVIGLPVGRTQLAPGAQATPEDERALQIGCALASAARPEHAELLGKLVAALLSPQNTELRRLFEQLSGAAAAKGIEDTAFYRYGALIALAEIGCDPDDAAFSLDDFHAHCAEIRQSRPLTMNTSSTHDSKRGEDTRLRIAALSEMPEAFRSAVLRWRELLSHAPVIDTGMQYHLFQTLVGAWPITEERLFGYALKAACETKRFTSWLERNHTYEASLAAYVHALVSTPAFVADLEQFLLPVRSIARRHSLAQLVLKLTVPGVPDLYQGSEFWEETLVDPDNRRAVDFAARRERLRAVRKLDAAQAVQSADDGTAKLFVLDRALKLRRQRASAFTGPDATYEPLLAEGREQERVIAFVRGERVISVVPRLLGRASRGFGDTSLALPRGRWRDVFTGKLWSGTARCSELWAELPVALLCRED